ARAQPPKPGSGIRSASRPPQSTKTRHFLHETRASRIAACRDRVQSRRCAQGRWRAIVKVFDTRPQPPPVRSLRRNTPSTTTVDNSVKKARNNRGKALNHVLAGECPKLRHRKTPSQSSTYAEST